MKPTLLADLVAELNPTLDETLRAQLASSMDALGALKSAAEADTELLRTHGFKPAPVYAASYRPR